MPESTKKKIKESKLGKSVHSEEYKKKLSERVKREWDNGERVYVKPDNCDYWAGKNLSEIHKNKISIGLKNSEKHKLGREKASVKIHNKFLKKVNAFRLLFDQNKNKKEIMLRLNMAEPTYYKYLRLIKKEKNEQEQ